MLPARGSPDSRRPTSMSCPRTSTAPEDVVTSRESCTRISLSPPRSATRRSFSTNSPCTSTFCRWKKPGNCRSASTVVSRRALPCAPGRRRRCATRMTVSASVLAGPLAGDRRSGPRRAKRAKKHWQPVKGFETSLTAKPLTGFTPSILRLGGLFHLPHADAGHDDGERQEEPAAGDIPDHPFVQEGKQARRGAVVGRLEQVAAVEARDRGCPPSTRRR